MSDEPQVVDLTPYVVGRPIEVGGAAGGRLTSLTFQRHTSPPRVPALDGPGYVVVSDGEPVPGQPVLIGSMPDGWAGGVTGWQAGHIAEADGMSAPADGEPGWYVPEGATHCPRCGDQNWTKIGRMCITCTHGDDAYADGAFADGWSARG